TVNAAAASKIGFTSATSSSTAGVESSNITVQLQDQFGNATTRGSSTTITPSASPAGTNSAFHDTSSATQTTFAIGAGSSAVSFRYYDEKSGSYAISIANNASLTNPSN